jgi:hypothetical protein
MLDLLWLLSELFIRLFLGVAIVLGCLCLFLLFLSRES